MSYTSDGYYVPDLHLYFTNEEGRRRSMYSWTAPEEQWLVQDICYGHPALHESYRELTFEWSSGDATFEVQENLFDEPWVPRLQTLSFWQGEVDKARLRALQDGYLSPRDQRLAREMLEYTDLGEDEAREAVRAERIKAVRAAPAWAEPEMERHNHRHRQALRDSEFSVDEVSSLSKNIAAWLRAHNAISRSFFLASSGIEPNKKSLAALAAHWLKPHRDMHEDIERVYRHAVEELRDDG